MTDTGYCRIFAFPIPSLSSDTPDPMRNFDKKPARRIDAHEPLEKLGLLHLKHSDRVGTDAGKTATDLKSGRPRRWM
jgi:hypothetical protein